MASNGPRSKIPKKLPAFNDAKVLGVFTCPTCGCVHYGISEQAASAHVEKMNAYLSSLDEQDFLLFYGGRKVTMGPFERCFYCSTPSGEMVPVPSNQINYSVSHQPVIVGTNAPQS